MSEIQNKCCGCEKIITGVVVQRDSGITMCEKCDQLAREYEEPSAVSNDERKRVKITMSFGLDDEEDTLTEYEQMVEDMLDQKAERIGMMNAGWKQTESGVFYYPDDDNPNIIHLSY